MWNRKVRLTAISLIYAVAAIATVEFMTRLVLESKANELEDKVQQSVLLAKSNLEAAFYRDVYLADSLATVVTINPSFANRNWDSIAAKLINKSTNVRHVTLAPNDIVANVYPLAGNEAILGVDFRSLTDQYKTIEAARVREDLVLAGPLQLIQGGYAIIGRYPIFQDYPNNQNYWGTVSVVIDYDSLFESSGFKQLSDVKIAIRHVNADGSFGNVFYGDEQTFQQVDLGFPIKLPSSTWMLGVQFDVATSPVLQTTSLFARGIGSFIVLVIYFAMLTLYRAYRVARRTSFEDELTGLANRRMMMRYLERLMLPRNNPPHFTVVNVDLNKFKAVNDKFGHEAGDALLRHIAKALEASLRATDIAGRMGGDEFLLVLERLSDPQKVRNILAELKEQIESSSINWQGIQINPSLSIGFAIYQGQNIGTDELLAEADKAMYQHKMAQRSVNTQSN